MKKKILGLFLCICLVLPCMMFLAACGAKKDININIYYYTAGLSNGVKEIRLIDSTDLSSSNWEVFKSIGNENIGKEITQFTAKEDSEIQIFIVLEPGYDINNVKVKPNGDNGEELSPSNSFKDSDSESWVYAYTVAKKLKSELWIMFSGLPALRSQTITLAESNAECFTQLEEGYGDPASVFLADATFSFYQELNGNTHDILTDLTIAEFKEKLESNYSFNIPASATLNLRVTTGAAAETESGKPQVVDFSSLAIMSACNHKQTLADTYSTISAQVFSNNTMTFDWREITSTKLLNGVTVNIGVSFRSEIGIKDVTREDGSSLYQFDDTFRFSEYNQIKDDVYYAKFDITNSDYLLLTDPLTNINLGYGLNYSSTEAIELGVLKFNSVENPTEAWINLKDVEATEYGTIWIYIEYNQENIAQNTNFQHLQFKTDKGDNTSSPYKFADFGLYYSDVDTDLMFVDYPEMPEEYRDDYTYSTEYSSYYLKGSKITINHLEVGYTSEKTNIYDMREQSIGQTISINFKTTNGTQTLTATFVEYEENCYHWQFENTPTWITMEGGDYYDQHLSFTIDTEALKTETGGDLYEIEVVMPDHIA